jgi:hypothetical protein
VDIQVWEVDLVLSQLPQAMWGDPVPPGKSPNINPATPTVTGATGVTMFPTSPDLVCTPEMIIDEVFADRVVNALDTFRLPISVNAPPQPGAPPQLANSFADIAQVNAAAVAGNRSALFSALQTFGISGWTNDPLPLMAAAPGKDFADEPLEGSPAPVNA